VHRALIAFERQDIIGFLVQDRRRNAALAVDGGDDARDGQQVQKRGNATIALTPSATLT